MMMKKEIPATIGLFDNQFNPCYFEDPDFCFRAFDAGYRIGWNPQAKIVHLAHSTLGTLGQKKKMERFMVSYKKFKEKWRKRPLKPLGIRLQERRGIE